MYVVLLGLLTSLPGDKSWEANDVMFYMYCSSTSWSPGCMYICWGITPWGLALSSTNEHSCHMTSLARPTPPWLSAV